MEKEQNQDEDREDPKMEEVCQKKQQIAKAKTQYTKTKNQLLRMLKVMHLVEKIRMEPERNSVMYKKKLHTCCWR